MTRRHQSRLLQEKQRVQTPSFPVKPSSCPPRYCHLQNHSGCTLQEKTARDSSEKTKGFAVKRALFARCTGMFFRGASRTRHLPAAPGIAAAGAGDSSDLRSRAEHTRCCSTLLQHPAGGFSEQPGSGGRRAMPRHNPSRSPRHFRGKKIKCFAVIRYSGLI